MRRRTSFSQFERDELERRYGQELNVRIATHRLLGEKTLVIGDKPAADLEGIQALGRIPLLWLIHAEHNRNKKCETIQTSDQVT